MSAFEGHNGGKVADSFGHIADLALAANRLLTGSRVLKVTDNGDGTKTYSVVDKVL